MMVARSPAVIASRRASACSSSMTPLRAASSRSDWPSTASPSIRHAISRPGDWARSEPIVASCAAVSTNTARACESLRIHCTCSAEDVS
jgi:hypothetical protein